MTPFGHRMRERERPALRQFHPDFLHDAFLALVRVFGVQRGLLATAGILPAR
jgi:hypothetical protein